jgi:hypothetical protein
VARGLTSACAIGAPRRTSTSPCRPRSTPWTRSRDPDHGPASAVDERSDETRRRPERTPMADSRSRRPRRAGGPAAPARRAATGDGRRGSSPTRWPGSPRATGSSSRWTSTARSPRSSTTPTHRARCRRPARRPRADRFAGHVRRGGLGPVAGPLRAVLGPAGSVALIGSHGAEVGCRRGTGGGTATARRPRREELPRPAARRRRRDRRAYPGTTLEEKPAAASCTPARADRANRRSNRPRAAALHGPARLGRGVHALPGKEVVRASAVTDVSKARRAAPAATPGSACETGGVALRRGRHQPPAPPPTPSSPAGPSTAECGDVDRQGFGPGRTRGRGTARGRPGTRSRPPGRARPAAARTGERPLRYALRRRRAARRSRGRRDGGGCILVRADRTPDHPRRAGSGFTVGGGVGGPARRRPRRPPSASCGRRPAWWWPRRRPVGPVHAGAGRLRRSADGGSSIRTCFLREVRAAPGRCARGRRTAERVPGRSPRAADARAWVDGSAESPRQVAGARTTVPRAVTGEPVLPGGPPRTYVESARSRRWGRAVPGCEVARTVHPFRPEMRASVPSRDRMEEAKVSTAWIRVGGAPLGNRRQDRPQQGRGARGKCSRRASGRATGAERSCRGPW